MGSGHNVRKTMRSYSQSDKAPQVPVSTSTSSSSSNPAQSAASSLASNIFTPSGNEALGYMEEDSAGQSNIFAFEPTKPYVSSKGGSLGAVAGGFFAVVTVVATLAIGYAGGQLYKQGQEKTAEMELKPLSYYASLYESELKAAEPERVQEQQPVFEIAAVAPELDEVVAVEPAAPVIVDEEVMTLAIEEAAPVFDASE